MKTKVAYFGVFLALTLIFGYIETLIPVNFGVPGIKLGLANLMLVIVIYKWNLKSGILLGISKVLLSNALFGNLSSMLFGLAGMFCSILLMGILKHRKRFGVVVISMIGGIAHNIGQIFMAALVLRTISIISYMPVLMIAGMITGICIGVLANSIIKRIKL